MSKATDVTLVALVVPCGSWSFVLSQGPKVQREADQEVRWDGAKALQGAKAMEVGGYIQDDGDFFGGFRDSEVPLEGLPQNPGFRRSNLGNPRAISGEAPFQGIGHFF